MKKVKKYHLYKKKVKNIKIDFIINSDVGYQIKPKNKISYDGITVSCMHIIDLDLIKVMLKKKIKKKLDSYLQFLITLLEEEDSDPGHLMFALNDLERYRRTVINNYKKYLEKKYLKILMDKFDLLEQEFRSKIKFEVKDMFLEQMELDLEESKKSRRR